MKFKPDVRVNGIKPEVLVALMVVQQVFSDINREVVVTSVTDGKHSRGSLHYAGQAVDFRTRHLTEEEKQRLFMLLRDALTEDFDVVLEETHLHLEYQPKEPY